MPDQASRDIPKNRNTSRQDFEAATTGGAMGGSSDGGATPGTIAGSMEQTGTTVEQARNMVRNLGEQARSAMAEPGATAQELARRAREQATMASDMLYQQGTRAGEYLTRNINEYPLTALLIAGAIGYGLGYLIHAQWQSSASNWSGTQWRDTSDSL